jgi:hypothetical protein
VTNEVYDHDVLRNLFSLLGAPEFRSEVKLPLEKL